MQACLKGFLGTLFAATVIVTGGGFLVIAAFFFLITTGMAFNKRLIKAMLLRSLSSIFKKFLGFFLLRKKDSGQQEGKFKTDAMAAERLFDK
jgi:hypothetical protein